MKIAKNIAWRLYKRVI